MRDNRCDVCGRWFMSFAARVLHSLRTHPERERPVRGEVRR